MWRRFDRKLDRSNKIPSYEELQNLLTISCIAFEIFGNNNWLDKLKTFKGPSSSGNALIGVNANLGSP